MRTVKGMHPASKPGFKTSELWSVAAALGTAVVACLSSDDRWVKIAALGALSVLGSVLGGLYVWSRTRLKSFKEE